MREFGEAQAGIVDSVTECVAYLRKPSLDPTARPSSAYQIVCCAGLVSMCSSRPVTAAPITSVLRLGSWGVSDPLGAGPKAGSRGHEGGRSRPHCPPPAPRAGRHKTPPGDYRVIGWSRQAIAPLALVLTLRERDLRVQSHLADGQGARAPETSAAGLGYALGYSP